MKACYASGVLSSFEEHGYRPFDAVYGTSAGGALVAWFSAGQARFAEATWDYASDPRILSYRRFLRGGPLLHHENLLDIVYLKERPIDQEAIRRSPHPVIVTAVDVHTGEVLYHDLRDGDIIPWLKATGRLPLGAGDPVVIGGRSLLDGGIVDPIPVRRAVADGHTRLTVVLNTPPGKRRPEHPLATAMVVRKYPRLRDGVVRHVDIKQAAIDYAKSPPPGVQADLVRPAAPTGVGRLTRDLEKIRRVLDLGRADGRAHLERIDAS